MEVTGIYCDRNVFINKYPAVRIYDRGKFYVPLSKRLQCPDGMLVKIKGKIIQLPVVYPSIRKTLTYNYLEPDTCEVISDTRELIHTVSAEYRRIRKKLEHEITISQSKLQLAADPNWDIWYNKNEQIFIFHSHQYDLMYAADIEFIVDARTQKINDVYAREWFKGEM